jgi:hypothetical protein
VVSVGGDRLYRQRIAVSPENPKVALGVEERHGHGHGHDRARATVHGCATYDLRRLRLKGLIERVPGSHRYIVTSRGLRVAYFYTKVYSRILRPGWASISSRSDSAARTLRSAFRRLDREIDRYRDNAARHLGAPKLDANDRVSGP